jgi:predicted nuclease with TOPRIM domain
MDIKNLLEMNSAEIQKLYTELQNKINLLEGSLSALEEKLKILEEENRRLKERLRDSEESKERVKQELAIAKKFRPSQK